jgi:hypothetical protein
MTQEPYIKVDVLDDEIEAGLVAAILEERGVPHLIRSYHDTAYDGLFQTQKGWGLISAPAAFHQEILQILDDVRQPVVGQGGEE